MNATQSLKIFEILNKHFKDESDAKAIVEQIELVVDNKFEVKKDILATKEDLSKAKIETIMWIVGIGVLQLVASILAKKYLN